MSFDDDDIVDAEVVEIDELSSCEPMKLPNRQDTLLTDNPERRCVAHKKNGDRCRKFAIEGATVCRVHGGAAGHVKAAARARLENAADRMAEKLLGIATDDNVAAETRLKAIVNALDRTIGKAPTTVEIGPAKPFEEIFDSIGGSAAREYNTPPPARLPSAQPHETAQTPNNPNYDMESLEALRRSASTSGLGSNATGEHGFTSRERPSAEADASAREDESRELDRERSAQAGGPHITGMDAIRIANYTNAQIGALRLPKELESPHKRYRRP